MFYSQAEYAANTVIKKKTMERKNKMIKKFSAMLAALALSVCVFTGCNNSSSSEAGSSSASDSSASSSAADSSSSSDSSDTSSSDSSTASSAADDSSKTVVTAKDPSLTIDGKKMDITNFTMCTIDGTPIDFMTFRYYYFYTLSQFAQEYGADINTIRNVKGGFEGVMTQTIESIKNSRSITDQLAKENNITLSEDDKKAVEEEFQNTKKQFGSEEEFQAQLKNAYLTEDILKKNIEYTKLTSIITDKLFRNDGKYATKKADFKNIVKDTSKYAHETHIQIPYCVDVELDAETKKTYDSLTLENKLTAKQKAYNALDDAGKQKAKQAAKAKADEVLKKALAGEDFHKLISEYGWDRTLAANNVGYYFSKDNTSFPSNIIEKAFTLKENEVAKDLLVDETYGYFIIKRETPDMEYIEKNIDAMIAEYDSPSIIKMVDEKNKAMTVKTCDNWDKITIDSIT